MSGFGGGFDTGPDDGGYYGGGYGDGGGGGYMQGGSGYGGYNHGSSATEAGSRSREESIQPVTIKQLNDAEHGAPDDKYVVNGVEVSLVTFLGRIMTCDVQITMITLMMDDCTGCANVVYVLDPQQDEYTMQKRQHVRELAWVRVVGNVREVDGSLQIDAVHIRAVEDMNEIMYHRLEVVRAFLGQTRPRPTSGSAPMLQGMSKGGISGSSAFNMSGADSYGAVGQMGMMENIDGMNPQQRQVYNFVKERYEAGSQQGVHIRDIVQHVHGLGEQAVREIMDVLASEGHVYSTIDEDHFAFCMA